MQRRRRAARGLTRQRARPGVPGRWGQDLKEGFTSVLDGWQVPPMGIHAVFPSRHPPLRVRPFIDLLETSPRPGELLGADVKRVAHWPGDRLRRSGVVGPSCRSRRRRPHSALAFYFPRSHPGVERHRLLAHPGSGWRYALARPPGHPAGGQDRRHGDALHQRRGWCLTLPGCPAWARRHGARGIGSSGRGPPHGAEGRQVVQMRIR